VKEFGALEAWVLGRWGNGERNEAIGKRRAENRVMMVRNAECELRNGIGDQWIGACVSCFGVRDSCCA